MFDPAAAESKYVAFVDILGFGRKVRESFDTALEIYEQVLGSIEIVDGMREDVSLRVYSDAFLLTSPKLGSMIGMIQALHMKSLFADCLVRGGIGFGKHLEVKNTDNLFVVSQPLVCAVETEKRIKYPCVGFHKGVNIPDHWWEAGLSNIDRGVLLYEEEPIVNPFNRYWAHSAMTRVAMMPAEFPEYREKYDWFLRLYDAVMGSEPLIPLDAKSGGV